VKFLTFGQKSSRSSVDIGGRYSPLGHGGRDRMCQTVGRRDTDVRGKSVAVSGGGRTENGGIGTDTKQGLVKPDRC